MANLLVNLRFSIVRKVLLPILMVLCTLCSVLAIVNMHNLSALAESSFINMRGASVRLMTDETSGIRFTADIAKSDYESKGTVQEAGFLVAKRSWLTGNLDLENYNGENTSKIKKIVIQNATEDNKFTVNEEGTIYYRYIGYMYKIPDTQFATDLEVVFYFTTNTGTYYSTQITRSFAYVAEKANEDRSETKTEKYQYLTSDGDYSCYDTTQLKQISLYVQYPLVTSSVNNYTIVYDNENANASKAANFLKDQIYAATGTTLPVVASGATITTPRVISIGNTQQLQDAGYVDEIGTSEDKLNLGQSGFILKRQYGNVYIAGYQKSVGSLYGVYEFLRQQFNAEIYANDEVYVEQATGTTLMKDLDATVVPDIETIIAGNGDGMISPQVMPFVTTTGAFAGSFSSDAIAPFHNYSEYMDSDDYSSDKRTNTVKTGGNFFTGYTYAYPDGYWFYYHEDIGDYYLCLAEKPDEIIQELLPKLAAQLDLYPTVKNISFSQPDGNFWCPHCVEDWNENTGSVNSTFSTAKEYYTAINIKFMTKLANALKTYDGGKYADVTLYMLGYAMTSDCPTITVQNGQFTLLGETLTVADNLGVAFTYSFINNYEGSVNTTEVDARLAKWQQITNKFYFWTYLENYENYFAPWDGDQQLQENMQYAAANGAEVYFAQGLSQLQVSIDWGALETYLTAKLMWNVNADETTVNGWIDDFFNQYYGAASTAMKELYSAYKTKMAALKAAGNWGSQYNLLDGYITTSNWTETELNTFLSKIEAAYTALESVRSTIGEARYNVLHDRVERESITFRYIQCALYDIDETARRDFQTACTSLGITHWSELSGISSLFNLGGAYYPAKAATCDKAGNVACYEKDGKYYLDAACTQEISDADRIIPARGHHYEITSLDNTTEISTCSRCDKQTARDTSYDVFNHSSENLTYTDNTSWNVYYSDTKSWNQESPNLTIDKLDNANVGGYNGEAYRMTGGGQNTWGQNHSVSISTSNREGNKYLIFEAYASTPQTNRSGALIDIVGMNGFYNSIATTNFNCIVYSTSSATDNSVSGRYVWAVAGVWTTVCVDLEALENGMATITDSADMTSVLVCLGWGHATVDTYIRNIRFSNAIPKEEVALNTTYCLDAEVPLTVTVEGDVTSVTYNGSDVDGATIDGYTVEIPASYMAGLAAGTYTFVVETEDKQYNVSVQVNAYSVFNYTVGNGTAANGVNQGWYAYENNRFVLQSPELTIVKGNVTNIASYTGDAFHVTGGGQGSWGQNNTVSINVANRAGNRYLIFDAYVAVAQTGRAGGLIDIVGINGYWDNSTTGTQSINCIPYHNSTVNTGAVTKNIWITAGAWTTVYIDLDALEGLLGTAAGDIQSVLVSLGWGNATVDAYIKDIRFMNVTPDKLVANSVSDTTWGGGLTIDYGSLNVGGYKGAMYHMTGSITGSTAQRNSIAVDVSSKGNNRYLVFDVYAPVAQTGRAGVPVQVAGVNGVFDSSDAQYIKFIAYDNSALTTRTPNTVWVAPRLWATIYVDLEVAPLTNIDGVGSGIESVLLCLGFSGVEIDTYIKDIRFENEKPYGSLSTFQSGGVKVATETVTNVDGYSGSAYHMTGTGTSGAANSVSIDVSGKLSNRYLVFDIYAAAAQTGRQGVVAQITGVNGVFDSANAQYVTFRVYDSATAYGDTPNTCWVDAGKWRTIYIDLQADMTKLGVSAGTEINSITLCLGWANMTVNTYVKDIRFADTTPNAIFNYSVGNSGWSYNGTQYSPNLTITYGTFANIASYTGNAYHMTGGGTGALGQNLTVSIDVTNRGSNRYLVFDAYVAVAQTGRAGGLIDIVGMNGYWDNTTTGTQSINCIPYYGATANSGNLKNVWITPGAWTTVYIDLEALEGLLGTAAGDIESVLVGLGWGNATVDTYIKNIHFEATNPGGTAEKPTVEKRIYQYTTGNDGCSGGVTSISETVGNVTGDIYRAVESSSDATVSSVAIDITDRTTEKYLVFKFYSTKNNSNKGGSLIQVIGANNVGNVNTINGWSSSSNKAVAYSNTTNSDSANNNFTVVGTAGSWTTVYVDLEIVKTIYSANADMDNVIIGLGWGGHDTDTYLLFVEFTNTLPNA